MIGGVAPGARNVISGNRSAGVFISGHSSNNQIQGNLIGTDITGINPLGNSGNGVQIEGLGATANNRIGGTAVGQGNTIAFNGQNGVLITGSDSGTNGNRNSIRRNAIFSNARLGIDLGGEGVTANDSGDGDLGPNGLQNFPIITLVTGDSSQTTDNRHSQQHPEHSLQSGFVFEQHLRPLWERRGSDSFWLWFDCGNYRCEWQCKFRGAYVHSVDYWTCDYRYRY